MSSAKWRIFCLGLNVLTHRDRVMPVCFSKLGRMCGAKPLSKPMMICLFDTWEQIALTFESKYNNGHVRK